MIKELIKSYRQGTQFLSTSEKEELANEIEENGFDIEDIRIYRGVNNVSHEVGDIIKVSTASIESWSEDEQIAERFSGSNGETSAVYELTYSGKCVFVADYDYDDEMEVILSSDEYRVIEKSQNCDEYITYTLEIV